MIEKILIPTDGSDHSKAALEYGIYVAKRLGAQVTGLHVVDTRLIQGPVFTDISGSIGLPPYQEFLPSIRSGLDERAEGILKAFRTRCEEAGFKPETLKSMGLIDETIINEGKQADLIVLARRGENFHLTAGGILGSTAESVVRKSGRHVMVTPESFKEIESMGLAYDGSMPAENALKLAVKLSDVAFWPLTILVITDDHELEANIIRKLDDFLEPLKIDSEIIILRGKEEREIIKFIQEGSIELMVMGAYGHNRLREFILGSTTSHVIRKSSVPVLLTR
jgi:nucleotide-binding universal stress UspA family protein